MEDKARAFGWQLRVLGASSAEEFASVFATLVSERIGPLVIGDETLFFSESRTLASLVVRNSVPAIGPLRSFADAGGLMSLGTNIPEMDRQAGIYVGRIPITRLSTCLAEALLRNPIPGIAGCCARAASGHAYISQRR
jgi:putative ABC transport system substrate-binding protein